MKTKKDIQELTAAEAGEVVNDLMEGQYDVDDSLLPAVPHLKYCVWMLLIIYMKAKHKPESRSRYIRRHLLEHTISFGNIRSCSKKKDTM